MKNKRRAALKELQEFQQRGGDISNLEIKEEVLYTGSHTFTVTLNPQVPEEEALLRAILALPARRRGPKIRDFAIRGQQGSPVVGRTLNVAQAQPTVAMPTAGGSNSKSALDKLEESW